DDILIRLTIANRGPEAARLHVLPTLWFRNTWSAGESGTKPGIRLADGDGDVVFHASHDDLGDRSLYCADRPAPLFTDNETNRQRIFNQPNPTPWVKDAFDRFLVRGDRGAVNPSQTGTKAAAHSEIAVGAGAWVEVRLRLTPEAPAAGRRAFDDFNQRIQTRQSEAD